VGSVPERIGGRGQGGAHPLAAGCEMKFAIPRLASLRTRFAGWRPYLDSVWTRRAVIKDDLRKKFGLYGETLLERAINDIQPFPSGLEKAGSDELAGLVWENRAEAFAWLQERRDIRERRDRTMRWIAWVTVFFVVLGFLLDHVFGSRTP
jgi:hypothetical protein